MAILMASFSKLEVTTERATVWWDLICDLTCEQFFTGLKKFCRDQKEIYPGTNIVAYIRAYSGIEENSKNPFKFLNNIPDREIDLKKNDSNI